MKTLTLKLPEILWTKLKVAARRTGRSQSALVREAMEAFLDSEERVQRGSFLDQARDLVGSLDGGPGNLATSKKHLSGYGR
jgi:plasmid stability protein